MILTLNEYKALKGKNPANVSEDTQITALISSVSSHIITYIGQDLVAYYNADKIEYFYGDMSNLYLGLFPIKETSVSVHYLLEGVYTALVEEEDYYVDYESGNILTCSGTPFLTAPRPRGIRVTYRAGFAAWPEDIKAAAADLIEYYLKNEKSTNKTMGGAETMQFDSSPRGRLPTHISRVLDMYRVPVL